MVKARIALVSLALGGCAAAPCQSVGTAPPDHESTHDCSDAELPSSGTISGVITHAETKKRVSSALVILDGDALPGPRETQTNARGLYTFGYLPPGRYQVQVLAGQADVSKYLSMPIGARYRANFVVDPDNAWAVCDLPSAPALNESLFSIDAGEAKLLRIPKTTILR